MKSCCSSNSHRVRLACEVAREAGALAQKLRREGLKVESKSTQDFVTHADRAVEKHIIDKLHAAYPEDGFLGEEGGLIDGEAGFWVIDPIDGTTNYLMGLDHWSVSIGYVRDGEAILGCLFAPDRDEMFEAVSANGARLNGVPIIRRPAVQGQLVFGLGVSGRVSFENYVQILRDLNANGIEHRRFGSGALSIAEVAVNRLDGYYEEHLNSWDATAALVVAKEAMADVVGFEDISSFENGDRLYVAAPGLRDCFGL